MENAVTFQSGKLTLEGRYAAGEGKQGVVITHPHPLYGGDMENPVVAAMVRAYGRAGYTTLRFNFRGAGRSTGFFDQGAGEAKDVAAALAFLSDRGVDTLHLAGYSFGAWVNARIDCSAAGVARMVMVSPPVAFMDYDHVGEIPCLHYVVTGSEDEIAPPALIRKHLTGWNPNARFEVIRGADHFYGIHLETLEKMLCSAVASG